MNSMYSWVLHILFVKRSAEGGQTNYILENKKNG